ncbi:hypothetical protein [Peribacillus muralis]|uniref:hypothetical protein n=1 Tax=Peribacillus muralis TaxID=264697 RepID=UPI003D04ED14
MKQQLDNKSYWNRIKEIYSLNFSPSGFDYNDLKVDRGINDKVDKLYQELKIHKNAFIMEADNFSFIEKNERKPIYFYTLNTTPENKVYSPAGRKVTISKNHLKINPITDAKGQNVIERLNNDSNTLNILVPKQYARYEEESYRVHLSKLCTNG